MSARPKLRGEPAAAKRNPRLHLLAGPLLYASVITLVIFGSYQIVEIKWLGGLDLGMLQLLHIVRGVVSSLCVGTFVGWMILRISPSFLKAPVTEQDEVREHQLTEAERIELHACWFIAMRWIAVTVALLLILLEAPTSGWLPAGSSGPLVLTVAALASFNLVYAVWIRWAQASSGLLLIQACVDLAVLTALLHFSGGVENPLSAMMIFHVIIAGILLSRQACYGIAAVGSLLFAALILAEYSGAWRHYPLQAFSQIDMPQRHDSAAQNLLYVLGRALFQTAILFLTAYFVTTLAERIRYKERRLATVADQASAGQQLLEQAMETTGTGLRVLLSDQQVCWTNSRWTEWLAALRVENDPDLRALDGANSPAAKCFQDGQTRISEVAIRDGRDSQASSVTGRTFQVTTAPLFDADGKVNRVVELVQEVTQQKRAQEQMLRAGKFAAIGELAGQVAHEVNNPIAIISAKASLLLSDKRDELSAKTAQELDKIKELANRVARIAQGLLSYCRPSVAARVEMDVRFAIRKSMALVEEMAARKQVRVVDELPAAMPFVKANANEMEQVFLNLLLNALDAMPKGGSLRISSRNDHVLLPEGRAGVAVTVADTGQGIPPELRARIFEPFFTTKQEGRGTGLGLSICLGLVRSHGGDIEVESVIGKGSRFIVKLPIANSAAENHHAY